MSRSLKLRHFLRDFNVSRLWSVWIRRYTLTSMVKRYRRDRSIREVFQCVKQTIYRSRTTLLLSATAAYKTDRDHEEPDIPCQKNISDEDLEALISDLDDIEELSKRTLYCMNCGRRSVIDKKHNGVRYCTCKRSNVESCCHDGWVPYMEADDVIIWRKEYKPGQSYAYKVYGRYPELNAKDFAAVQVDGSYRKAWDAAVAFLKVIQEKADGIKDQTVLHWEVMWPRMFSNRDYVFIRRHKQFNITNKFLEYKEELFRTTEYEDDEVPNVHSNAKRIALEAMKRDRARRTERDGQSKVFVIISRSCVHDDVPETKNAVRVKEYWSHMVVKSLESGDKVGMEFVLTYYDDAGSGGLPGGVASWATGRAAPAYLKRMRRATADYQSSGQTIHMNDSESQEVSSDESTQTESPAEMITQLLVTTIENITRRDEKKIEEKHLLTKENCLEKADISVVSMKTDASKEPVVANVGEDSEAIRDDGVRKDDLTGASSKCQEAPVSDKEEDRPEETNGSWWRYMYPFYYFL